MFSGIGGFERGIEQSGVDMECIGYSEIDKYARSIYERHYPNHINWGDATEIDPRELPDFDFLVGGFPCQAFSLAGKRKGFDDTRGTLFFEIARILREKRPRYFLLENVKGLLSHDKGQTFKTILGILSELGYDVEWEVLNSKNFGVPQNRERIFIKGYFRAECGGEILSQKRDSREIIGEMIWGWTSTKVGKFVDPDGLGLTLCAEGHNCGRNQLITVNEGKAQAQKVYDEDGIATTLCGCGGGQGGKTGLYKVGNVSPSGHHNGDVFDENGIGRTILARDYKDPMKVRVNESEIKKVGSVAANGHWGKNVYDPDGICPSLCSGSLHKNGTRIIEKESEIKKCYGSTQKHRAETDGSYSPTLTSAMGEGGGHVPMVETEDEPEFVRMHGSNQEHRMISEDTCCTLNNHRTPMVEFDKPLKIRTDVEKGYVEAEPNDGVRLDHPNSNTRRGTVQKEGTGTISASCDWGTVDKDFRIRRLTPKECERLQGFPDDWTKYGKDGEIISDTQRYKCCGNAVTVNVIEFLIRSMFG